jgi:hypothetical protein
MPYNTGGSCRIVGNGNACPSKGCRLALNCRYSCTSRRGVSSRVTVLVLAYDTVLALYELVPYCVQLIRISLVQLLYVLSGLVR